MNLINILSWQKEGGVLNVLIKGKEYTYYYVDEFNYRRILSLLMHNNSSAVVKLLKNFSHKEYHNG